MGGIVRMGVFFLTASAIGRKAESSDTLAKLEILAVGVCGKTRLVEAELSVFIEQLGINVDGDYVGEEEIMRALRYNVKNATFKRERAFCYQWGGNLLRRLLCKSRHLEFIHLGSGIYSAIVRSTD